nr:MAG: hypothetical protein GM42_1820 [actinobacterium acMicro-1]
MRLQNSRGFGKVLCHDHLRRCNPTRVLCSELVSATGQVVKLFAELTHHGVPR